MDDNLLKVPYVENLDKLIFNMHKELGHRNHNFVRQHFLKNNMFFKGITKKIMNICKIYQISNIKTNAKLRKREKSKLIIFNKPKVRYIADLTDIPLELRKGTDYLYILNIIDDFS